MKAGSVSSVSLDEINARARDSGKPRTATIATGFRQYSTHGWYALTGLKAHGHQCHIDQESRPVLSEQAGVVTLFTIWIGGPTYESRDPDGRGEEVGGKTRLEIGITAELRGTLLMHIPTSR